MSYPLADGKIAVAPVDTLLTGNEGEFASGSTVRDYITLLKPGVMMLVVFTGFVGMYLAPATMHPLLQIMTVLCIAIGSGAGGAINMWFDRDIDAHMLRTADRPIPAGRVAPDDALVYGLFLSIASVSLLGLAVNWLAAAYLAGAIGFYVFIYTVWLKRRTPQNIVIGGAAGAFPPVIGWVAATGEASIDAWILFGIIFLWTPPHFWALALYRNSDYTRVGVPMLPVVAGKPATKKQMLIYTLILLPVTLLPCATGLSGWVYAACATVLSLQFCRHAWKVMHSEDDATARAMFGYSILYLFAIFLALIIDKVIDRFGLFAFL
ncbi:MAG: heme o synthase [Alphaproteobacteria bacterium]|nr:heme o synthase [Alphaproteobacteria bacterium]